MLLPKKLQYAVTQLFADDANARRNKVLPFEDLDELENQVPAIRQWEYKEEYGDALVEFCLSSVAKVHEDWEKDHPRPPRPVRQAQPRSRANSLAGSPAASPARPASLLANTLNRAAVAAAATQAVEAAGVEEVDEEVGVQEMGEADGAEEAEEAVIQPAIQPSTPARNLAVPAYVSQVTPIPMPIPGAPIPMAAPKTPKPPRKRAPAQPTTPNAAATPAPYSTFDTGVQQLMDELTPRRQAAPTPSFQELLQRYETQAAASPFPSPTAAAAAAAAASPIPAVGRKRTNSIRTPIPGSPAYKK